MRAKQAFICHLDKKKKKIFFRETILPEFLTVTEQELLRVSLDRSDSSQGSPFSRLHELTSLCFLHRHSSSPIPASSLRPLNSKPALF